MTGLPSRVEHDPVLGLGTLLEERLPEERAAVVVDADAQAGVVAQLGEAHGVGHALPLGLQPAALVAVHHHEVHAQRLQLRDHLRAVLALVGRLAARAWACSSAPSRRTRNMSGSQLPAITMPSCRSHSGRLSRGNVSGSAWATAASASRATTADHATKDRGRKTTTEFGCGVFIRCVQSVEGLARNGSFGTRGFVLGSDVQNSIFAGTVRPTWLDDGPRKLNSVRLTPCCWSRADCYLTTPSSRSRKKHRLQASASARALWMPSGTWPKSRRCNSVRLGHL